MRFARMFQPHHEGAAIVCVPEARQIDARDSADGGVRRLRLLTLFRFLAAFWVLLFHLQSLLQVPAPFSRFVQNGAYAMSFFFVLSGVVLAYGYFELNSGTAELKEFYLRRLARIYPSYLVVHLAGLAWLPVASGDWTRWSYINASSLIGIQAWFPWANLGVNAGTWSISCEIFFYLLFPALLPLAKQLNTGARQLRAAVCLCLFIGFLGLADFAFAGGGTFPLLYISPLIRLPEFLLGMVIGVAIRHRDATWRMPGWVMAIAVGLVVLVSFNSAHEVGLWTRANLIVVPAIAWFLYTAASCEFDRPSPRSQRFSRLLQYIGEMSYALFLVQLPLLLSLRPALAGVGRVGEFIAGSPRVAGGLIILTVAVLAVALHEWVEKPARKFLLQRWA